MPKQGFSFRIGKFHRLLDVINSILPMGGEEWNNVEHEHNIKFLEKNCVVEMLCRKFQLLNLMKPPTGDPTIPPEVERAKQTNNPIKLKADILVGENTKNQSSYNESKFVPEALDKEQQVKDKGVVNNVPVD
jgi:hypothetical protein